MFYLIPYWAKSAPGWWDNSPVIHASKEESGRARPARFCSTGRRWRWATSASKNVELAHGIKEIMKAPDFCHMHWQAYLGMEYFSRRR